MPLHPFAEFLREFTPLIEKKSKQLNQAVWILATTGSGDAAELKASLDTELNLIFQDADLYKKLTDWNRDPSLVDRVLKRQLNVLIRCFKQMQIPKELVQAIAEKEAALEQTYGNFRAELNGRSLSENEVRELLKTQHDPVERKKLWEASKQIGDLLAPQILELVKLRNKAARLLGYADYFEMKLDLQEVNRGWLEKLFFDLAQQSDRAYRSVIDEIEKELAERFHVSKKDLGPWAWSDPFCQEDPLGACELDRLAEGLDIAAVCRSYYEQMGFEVASILDRSDLYERAGKNQHAFCIHIDRKGDVRTLNNICPSIKWLETLLHELGHAVYELGYGEHLPWILREPPHMLTTEAMALVAGRQAYRKESLASLARTSTIELMEKAQNSLRRRQLIFSRYVLVMTAFESELYANPMQDLNALWWSLVERYQFIRPPSVREKHADWAAKYHIGLAPAYYFSYLLGELFASAIQEAIEAKCDGAPFCSLKAGRFLQKEFFEPGNLLSWNELIAQMTGKPLSADAWLREFG